MKGKRKSDEGKSSNKNKVKQKRKRRWKRKRDSTRREKARMMSRRKMTDLVFGIQSFCF